MALKLLQDQRSADVTKLLIASVFFLVCVFNFNSSLAGSYSVNDHGVRCIGTVSPLTKESGTYQPGTYWAGHPYVKRIYHFSNICNKMIHIKATWPQCFYGATPDGKPKMDFHNGDILVAPGEMDFHAFDMTPGCKGQFEEVTGDSTSPLKSVGSATGRSGSGSTVSTARSSTTSSKPAAAGSGQWTTMAECSAKFKKAKAENNLGGMAWNDFRIANCGPKDQPQANAVARPSRENESSAQPYLVDNGMYQPGPVATSSFMRGKKLVSCNPNEKNSFSTPPGIDSVCSFGGDENFVYMMSPDQTRRYCNKAWSNRNRSRMMCNAVN